MNNLLISPPPTVSFIVTKEYRRFAEFCAACRRYKYIGLCYGPPGVGKTLSALFYTSDDPRNEEGSTRVHPHGYATLFTPTVSQTPRQIDRDLDYLMWRALPRDERFDLDDPADQARMPPLELLLVDEADRLTMAGLEHVRDLYDRRQMGLVLIGMPGLEKRLARYAQLYSRVGFVHAVRPLSSDEVRFLLTTKWAQLSLTLQVDDFTDHEAVSAVIRITGGNFRLIHRLFNQIERILQINDLRVITKEVVEAARDGLVIGMV
jgi:DNA transposition AAA+ family ATPase